MRPLVDGEVALFVHAHSSQEALDFDIPLMGLFNKAFVEEEETAPAIIDEIFVLGIHMSTKKVPLWGSTEAKLFGKSYRLFDGLLRLGHGVFIRESDVEISQGRIDQIDQLFVFVAFLVDGFVIYVDTSIGSLLFFEDVLDGIEYFG